MASKQVAARTKSATIVGAAATSHGETIQAAVIDLLAPHLKKGEKMPDVAFLATVIGRALEQAESKMSAADHAHEVEMADDDGPRERRDATFEGLYAKTVEISEIIGGVYGAAEVRALKLDGTTPREPALLLRYATTVSNLMRKHTFGKARLKSVKLSGADMADQLDELASELKASLDDVAREKREGEATLVKKHDAIASYDATFSRSATLLSALLAFGGQAELASRVRPSVRRPGQTVAEGDQDGGDEPPTPQPTE